MGICFFEVWMSLFCKQVYRNTQEIS